MHDSYHKDLSTCRKADLDQVRALTNLYQSLKEYKKYNDLIPLLSSLLKNSKKDDAREHYRILGYIYELTNAYLESGDAVNATRFYKTHTPFMVYLSNGEKEEMEGLYEEFKVKLGSQQAQVVEKEKSIVNIQEQLKAISVKSIQNIEEPALPTTVEISG